MKPPGLEFRLSGGALTLGVTRSDRVTDAIWEAVEEAIDCGMTPERFKREMICAWEHYRREQAKRELAELTR